MSTAEARASLRLPEAGECHVWVHAGPPDRWRVARRAVVGAYLRPGSGWRLDRTCRLCGGTGHGKPRLVTTGGGAAPLELSAARSGSVGLLAMALSEVGVDVEVVRPDFDWAAVAEDVFCGAEEAAVAAAEVGARPVQMFERWVQKEAVLKAAGLGVAGPLDQVDTTTGAWREWAFGLIEVPAVAGSPAVVAALAWRGSAPAVLVRDLGR